MLAALLPYSSACFTDSVTNLPRAIGPRRPFRVSLVPTAYYRNSPKWSLRPANRETRNSIRSNACPLELREDEFGLSPQPDHQTRLSTGDKRGGLPSPRGGKRKVEKTFLMYKLASGFQGNFWPIVSW